MVANYFWTFWQFCVVHYLNKSAYIVWSEFKMAQPQTLEIKMARFENSPWGFRLHGGADFATPLTIQKVRHQQFINWLQFTLVYI